MKRSQNLGLVVIAALTLVVTKAGAAHAQAVSVLYNFGSQSGDPLQPSYSGIVAQGRDGNLYTTSVSGGNGTGGTVFKITPSGALKVLFNFDSTHGASPYGGLTLGSDGKFYGTATTGGAGASGTIFKITSSGTLTVIHNFSGPDGGAPIAPPIQGRDGKFYGTTVAGVGATYGTVYQVTATGKFKTLYSFDVTHGAYPQAPLIQGTDGDFYGTTTNGGSGSSDGEVFKITSKGILTVLFPFDGVHGVSPYGPLIQASDGNFYGTTFGGGANNFGTVFKMAPDGTTSVLHSFNFSPDGGRPTSGLVQGSDGTFYGTTSQGGTLGFGTVFSLTGNTYKVLYTFDQTTGAYPLVTLMQHTSGLMYAVTQRGGTGPDTCPFGLCSGVFYSLSEGLGTFVSLVAPAAKVGKTIGILGQGFKGTTAVSFGATPATFRVVSATYLTATVPSGANTSPVTVTTPGGTLTSNRPFQVLP
jgi:uncharacterized repeat protein (TIGR03803 family)